MSPLSAGKVIVFLLRLIGINALLAYVFILMPFSWFQEIHEWLGLGEMPDTPVVGYLARNLCLFYAVFGAVLITVSFDLERHRRLLWLFGILLLLIGFTHLGIDLHEKLPISWTLSEGPFTIIFAAVFFWLLRIWESDRK